MLFQHVRLSYAAAYNVCPHCRQTQTEECMMPRRDAVTFPQHIGGKQWLMLNVGCISYG